MTTENDEDYDLDEDYDEEDAKQTWSNLRRILALPAFAYVAWIVFQAIQAKRPPPDTSAIDHVLFVVAMLILGIDDQDSSAYHQSDSTYDVDSTSDNYNSYPEYPTNLGP